MEQLKVRTSMTLNLALKWSQIFLYIQNPVNLNITEVMPQHLPSI